MWRPAALVLIASVGCGGGGGIAQPLDAARSDGAGTDGRAEVGDAAAPGEASADVGLDVAADAVADLSTDAAADGAADAPGEARADATADAAADATADATSDGTSDATSDAPSDRPPAPTRRLGIDVGPAAGESYGDAFRFATMAGIDFVPLHLNWRDIEAGPDDDFHFSALDPRKWDRSVPSGTLEISAGALAFTETGAGTALARASARYTLVSAEWTARAIAELRSTALSGTEVTLLARVTTDAADRGGNACAAAADNYAALVLGSSGGSPFVVGATCSNGVFAATTAAVPAAGPVELGIRRTATDVVFEHRSPGAAWRPVASLPRAGLSPAFAAPARPYLYFGNPASGTTEARVDELHVTGEAAWDDPRDRFSFDPAWDILATVDLVYGTELDRPLALTLRTINTSALEIPSDLQDVPFDDARMKARYRAFVDHVFSRIPAVELLSVSVGNEIDGWLGAASGRWAQYASFAADAIPHARAAWTHGPILVGATATTGGLRGRPADLAAVNATADVAMLTYYPLRGDFTVEDPSVVAADFTSFVALTNLPLFFAEAGYPSAGPSPACAICNSSERKQADFVSSLFGAWDAHAARIAAINVNWLTDASAATVEGWRVYYGIDAPSFLAFLATLGLRQPDGTVKEAWRRLVAEATSRGIAP